jgi:hypothetical protein
MNNKRILQETVNSIVHKIIEEKRNEQKLNILVENILRKNLQKISEGDKSLANKKRAVLQWLNKPEIDAAAIRRKLEGEPQSQEEEDSKRSYFMKKVNQSYGKDFTDDEVNSLYSLKSSLGQ